MSTGKLSLEVTCCDFMISTAVDSGLTFMTVGLPLGQVRL